MDANTPANRPAPPPPTPRAHRQRGLQLGRVGGVPIYLNASWLILAVIVVIWYAPLAQEMLPQLLPVGAYALAVGFVLSLLVSVMLHELGHALMARRFGIGVRAITLELLGGYTEMESDSPNARADLFVSLIGPAVSGVLGLAALGLRAALPDGGIADQLAFQLAWSNLIVAVFNALPGLPLDGGRALRAIVWGITGSPHKGSKVAGWIGRFVAALTLGVALILTYAGLLSIVSMVFAALVAVTLWQGATAAILQARVAVRLPGVNLRQMARPVFRVAPGTPLAEATRRAAEAGVADAALAVADGYGNLVALVHEEAAAAVPMERRPWVPVESVSRTIDPGQRLAVDLTGEDVVRAVQAHPAPNYVVVAGEDVIGVLRTADLARALNS